MVVLLDLLDLPVPKGCISSPSASSSLLFVTDKITEGEMVDMSFRECMSLFSRNIKRIPIDDWANSPEASIFTFFLSELGHLDKDGDVDDQHGYEWYNECDHGVEEIHGLDKMEPFLVWLTLMAYARHIVESRCYQSMRVEHHREEAHTAGHSEVDLVSLGFQVAERKKD